MTILQKVLLPCLALFMMPASVFAATEAVEVLGTGKGVLEAKAKGKVLRLLTPEKKHWLIRGLAKGDRVTVSYEEDGDKKILTDVQGKGSIIGEVVNIKKPFITIKTAESVEHRLMPRWIGGMPKDGGGHDKAVLKQIMAVEKGQRVKLSWVIEEGKRVTSVKALSK